MSAIRLPNLWKPRPYQHNAWSYLERGGKRLVEVAHRRWGKDDISLNWTAVSSAQDVGTYWHMLPEASQARKAIWEAVNPKTGKRRIDEAFPHEIREATRENEMFIRFKTGSTWQVLGSDNYNSAVGSPPRGIVFSEWALADPNAWPYLMPILEENGGWAIFIYTPRGRNHGSTFYEMAKSTPGWFAEKQTVDDTDVFTKDQLQRIRKEMIDFYGADEGLARFMQEYYCSFDSALPGAYYGTEMAQAENSGRITSVPYKQGVPVDVVMDLGHGDSMALWFVQMVGFEPRLIEYHESNRGSIPGYAQLLKEKKYYYGKLILPHDGGDGRLSTGISYAQQFEEAGFNVQVLPKGDLDADIIMTRSFISECYFDAKKCARGIECLRNYHRKWDDKNKVFSRTPKHDWSSHGSDGFRYVAVANRMGILGAASMRGDDDFYTGDDGFDDGTRSSISGY